MFWLTLGFGLMVFLENNTKTWTEGMTLPSGRYLEHPPQYFPPSPSFPLPNELAAQERLPYCGNAPRPVTTVADVIRAVVTAYFTNLSQNQTVSDRLVLPTAVTTALRSYVTDGSVQHLLVTVGGQWDVGPAFTLGALVTSPGLRIGGNSQVVFSETVFDAAGGESDLVFRDSKAKLDYKLPLRATAGATFRYSRGQVELDVRYYAA